MIRTVKNGFPLNVMYWMKNDEGSFEVLDGQQRTINLGQYLSGDFSIDSRYFHNLPKSEQEQILDYELMIYHCEGTDKERLDWFRIINIAGEKLTDQELLNAVYTGPWLSDAKLKFSKTNCAAYLLANDGGALLNGSPIRQELLETALEWINGGDLAGYMASHQPDPNANELWIYYRNVIDWVRLTFTTYRKEMKGIAWGPLYGQFRNVTYDTVALEKEIAALMVDDDVTNKKGIYNYVLTGSERFLNIRAFTDQMRRGAYERQKGICAFCGQHFRLDQMEADHVAPWSEGGRHQSITARCSARTITGVRAISRRIDGLEEQSMVECEFCKIVSRRTPAEVIYETPTTLAFFPLKPATRGHTMVIPKQHVANFLDASPATMADLAVVSSHVGRAIDQVMQPDGMNLITSAGEAASQSVMHLHVHLVPRWWDDTIGDIWPPKVPTSEKILDSVADALRDFLGSVALEDRNDE